jgi:hypothetical protein
MNTCVTQTLSPLAEKERQLVWLLTRQLAEAQAMPGGRERVERLWQEAAALEIDPDRLIGLLYGGHDLSDRAVLAELDPGVAPTTVRRSSRWIPQAAPGLMRWLNHGGGPRNAPPAAPRAHPAGR